MSFHIRTPELEAKIVLFYQQGMSARKILRELGQPFKTTKSIYDILDSYGIPRRGPKENKRTTRRRSDYFLKIDSKKKAYILGLLITDGWLGTDGTVGFSSVDRFLTELIASEITWGHGVTIIPSGHRRILGRTCNTKTAYQFAVKDSFLIESLNRWGLQVEKTGNEILPAVSDALESHLLRGILDGDGCIYTLSNGTQPGVLFYSSSVPFLRQIDILLYKNLSLSPGSLKVGASCSKLCFYKKQTVDTLLEWIYKDSEGLRLDRKYETYGEIQHA